MSELLREQLQLLPDYLGRHMLLTIVALAAGTAISMPLSIIASRVDALRRPLLAAASIIQTIPALALLALFVLLLSQIGFVPAVAALILYSMLPVIRNTITGLQNVDENIVQAARGIGMTEGQILFKVQLPLAMPVILAGVRTATVWTVGMATLSTPAGATSLGNYIFSGLQTMNYVALTVGVVSAALLAIVLDALIGLLELASRKRTPLLAGAAILALTIVVLGGLWPVLNDAYAARSRQGQNRSHVVIGAKGFTEQYILANLMADRLEASGYTVETLESLGSAIAFEVLSTGKIDCYVDYTGTVRANYMKRDDNPGAEAVYAEMKDWLATEHDIYTLGALGFENAYALAVRHELAEEDHVASIADLAPFANQLVMGSDYEFYSRPEWAAVRDAYGLEFKDKRSFDPALMYQAAQAGQVDVISAFSTDGRIAAYDLVVLRDPEEALLPYDAVILLSSKVAKDKKLIAALQPLIGQIDDDEMRSANKMRDVDGDTIAAAVQYLEKHIDE
ncbi:MAG: ABC transporter permease/substrate-binding protein [Candidatus Hydrogenedentes bacterium]|nr:ABC transporter permease/substrate-binding protein [Candidatus Hydrogenedentota bacterium]